MTKLLSALAVTATLALIPSQASAWVCRADGVGAMADGRGYSAGRAKVAALRRCERRSLARVCTIRWCRE